MVRMSYSPRLLFIIVIVKASLVCSKVPCNSVKQSDVLVLGAGVSGLAVAETLYQNDIRNFLVLEAQDYIGGRIKHVNFAGYLAPLGAGWIHGIGDDNPMWVLSRKHELQVHYDDYSDVIIRNIHNGKETSNLRDMKKLFMEAADKSEKYITDRLRKGYTDLPFQSTLAMHGWKPVTPEMKAFDYFMADFESGISTRLTSATVYGITGLHQDVIVTDPRGYAHILEKMAEPFRERVLLNQVVTEVQRAGNSYLVQVKGGRCYKARYVVVTFSSGVLTSGAVNFVPNLPDWKYNAFALVPMCHYCKVFMRFPRKFWEDKNYILLGNEVQGKFVHWQNFEKPTLFAGKNVFMVTVTEERCQELQLKTDTEVIKETMDILRKVYGSDIPNPIEILRNNWSQNPFVQGSYSNPVVGITAHDWRALLEPVGEGLWFTGEHTAGPDDYGFTHGAYSAGKKQAQRLIKCMVDGDCPKFKDLKPKCVKVTM